MILVTGATGTIGSEVLRQLLAAGWPVRALTRSPEKLAGTAADVVQGDFDDPDSLARAMDGVEAVFLLTVARPPSARHDETLLKVAGDATIVKLSGIGAGEVFDGGTVGHWNLAAEQVIKERNGRWTILRPSSFATNVLTADGQPVINPTGDAQQGVIDPHDIAAVAVQALTRSGHDGQTYTLTGPELLSVPQQVSQLSEISGRPVPMLDVEPAELARQLAEYGEDPASIEAMLRGIGFARAGRNAVLTDDVERVLGRPAGSFANWARRHFPEPSGQTGD
ncbi:NAD-dependent epimerase/dehydratase family protein [Kribbella antibiotica]|uniref:NAD-dependent epimerase/dehydratase family protein n=1 Tax=Kribbella antibiotica TaxID=190195 RepID=A0A4V2YQ43_9ACTN|nr:NAD(P)H-binding protein [Kribbella antibiotica]TDD60467.1 NAD-dependent epimerase/dehydratase family protein [Kribbella antibiotica]